LALQGLLIAAGLMVLSEVAMPSRNAGARLSRGHGLREPQRGKHRRNNTFRPGLVARE
jgi:hypothetical protein